MGCQSIFYMDETQIYLPLKRSSDSQIGLFDQSKGLVVFKPSEF